MCIFGILLSFVINVSWYLKLSFLFTFLHRLGCFHVFTVGSKSSINRLLFLVMSRKNVSWLVGKGSNYYRNTFCIVIVLFENLAARKMLTISLQKSYLFCFLHHHTKYRDVLSNQWNHSKDYFPFSYP